MNMSSKTWGGPMNISKLKFPDKMGNCKCHTFVQGYFDVTMEGGGQKNDHTCIYI